MSHAKISFVISNKRWKLISFFFLIWKGHRFNRILIRDFVTKMSIFITLRYRDWNYREFQCTGLAFPLVRSFVISNYASKIPSMCPPFPPRSEDEDIEYLAVQSRDASRSWGMADGMVKGTFDKPQQNSLVAANYSENRVACKVAGCIGYRCSRKIIWHTLIKHFKKSVARYMYIFKAL